MSDWLLGPLVAVWRSDMVSVFLEGVGELMEAYLARKLGWVLCPVPLQSLCGFLGMVVFLNGSLPPCVVPREQCHLCTGTFQRFGLLRCTSELLN